MSEAVEIRVPDIGDVDVVDVVEVLVSVGDTVKVDDSLITLESDKASMEVPSTHDGVIQAVHVALGDQVGEAALIVTIEAASAVDTEPAEAAAAPVAPEEPAAPAAAETSQPSPATVSKPASPPPEAPRSSPTSGLPKPRRGERFKPRVSTRGVSFQ